MAIIKCKECGADVYEKAETCNKCGAPTAHAEQKSSNRWALLVVIIILFLGNPSKEDHLVESGITMQAEYYNNYLLFSTLTDKDDEALWSVGYVWIVKSTISLND